MRQLNFVLTVVLLVGAAGIILPVGSMAEYPERPIKLIVPWGAGGGTDSTARVIANLLQAELGQPVNVINRDGGSGVVGHSAIALAKPDGYTIGIATVEIGMMHWAGLTDLNWEAYTPIALYNTDPAGVIIRADSEWSSLNDIFTAARKNPGRHKGSGTGQGGIWHLALAGMLKTEGIEPSAIPWVPSKGAAAGLQELVASGVDIVTSSVVEASGLIAADKVKVITVMSDRRLQAFPNVPTLIEAGGKEWAATAWRGIVAPGDLPINIVFRLESAMEIVWNSEAFQNFMNNRGFGLAYKSGDDFADFMRKSDNSLGEAMALVGLAK
jgi:tripartite-type tricarboxylate transporter receptor subunit TctC